MLCSGVFVSGRSAQSVIDEDIMAGVHPLLRLVHASVDETRQRAHATFLGMASREAQFRPGLGCTLAIGVSADELAATSVDIPRPVSPSSDLPVAAPPAGVDMQQLHSAVDSAFEESDPRGQRRTRAVVILHRGSIIAERYAPGFTPDTPQLGWSMTKTITGALIGVVVGEGRLSLQSRQLLPEWRAAGDARGQIQLAHLLRMTSGLAFDESYDNPLSDVTRMILETGDGAGFAAAKPLRAAPGTSWAYSSGTSYLLGRVLREVAGPDVSTFARRALFDPLGMRTAVLEVDAGGTPVTASFAYASARDWARFGQFLLQDGTCNGKRILPEGWVHYMTTLTPESPEKDFGAHAWVRVPAPFNGETQTPASLPEDAFHAAGHEGQFVSVIPSRNLVVVRLGMARPESVWNQTAFLAHVLGAFPD
jgi:CubicO group peptidase (beta-lactamase class C family)